uniref:NADH dehydrogenase subunit 6 n=1 Tax=Philagra albinotata TaxID=868271 RepID=UPI002551CE96|nr:NADH dehydrogenase subunit 6 [Philagra albinotata]WGL39480.1 NADH dehydrogenase subunit 6 [Philagra albinotata]
MKLMIMIYFLISTTMFPMMKHPLSMGFMLLVQTIFSCMVNSMSLSSYWFSYILFIIFIGGMMVLFIYVASVASNEKFKFSFSMFMLINMFIMMSFMLIYLYDEMMIINENFLIENLNYKMNMNMNLINKEVISIMKMFNYPTMMITIIAIIHLLITMISIVKITNIMEGPLRMKK